jgi:hypothetical protein
MGSDASHIDVVSTDEASKTVQAPIGTCDFIPAPKRSLIAPASVVGALPARAA